MRTVTETSGCNLICSSCRPSFDGTVKDDLTAAYGKAACGYDLCNVARRNGTVEDARVRGLADEDKALAV